MIKSIIIPAALVAGGILLQSAQAQTLQTGRSAYRHYTAVERINAAKQRRSRHVAFGVGGRNARTTATGGNAGGYADRN